MTKPLPEVARKGEAVKADAASIQKMPGATPSNGLEGANGGAPLPTPAQAPTSPWRSAETFREFRAACECFGTREIARLLGYASAAEVSRARNGRLASAAAVEARWEVATSKGLVAQMTVRTRKVGKRGIKWDKFWLTAPALQPLVGRQVVVRGAGTGRLVVFEVAFFKPVCVLLVPGASA